MNIEQFNEFKNSVFLNVVKEYLQEQIDKMSDVSTCKMWDEVLGRQNAIKILKDLIHLMEVKPEKEKIPNQYK
jgi:hypothetical protein